MILSNLLVLSANEVTTQLSAAESRFKAAGQKIVCYIYDLLASTSQLPDDPTQATGREAEKKCTRLDRPQR